MMKLKTDFNRILKLIDKRLVLILILYLILGLILIGYYQHQINYDGLGYILTAEKYLGGDFYGAVDAYWGPLISWLLIPFLYFNQAPAYALYSTKILSLIIGFFTLIGVRQLSLRFEMDELVRTTVLLTMVPVLIYFSLKTFTPDLLGVCLMVYYFAIIFNPKYPDKVSNGLMCGVLGALAYFSKSYFFIFFITSFLALNLLHFYYRKDHPKIKISRNMIMGFIIFLIISSVWIGLISSKENKLTFGTSGEYNYAKFGPQTGLINGKEIKLTSGVVWGYNYAKFGTQTHISPFSSQGIHAPIPVNHSVVKNWSPLDSWTNFVYQLHLIKVNLLRTISFYQSFSCISILILICCFLLFIRPLKNYTNQKSREPVLFSLISIIIFSGGYLPVVVEGRYLWIVDVLLILLGGYLISLLFKNISTKNVNTGIIKGTVLILFSLSFILMPLHFLHTNLNTGKDIYTLSEKLKNYGVHGNIATNDELVNNRYFSFYLNTTSFGQSKKHISRIELQKQLIKYNIDYYLVWGSSTPNIIGYTEITKGKIKGLKIYKKN